MAEGFGTFLAISLSIFGVFFVCMCCCICCAIANKRKRQALFSTPVVVTGQTFQPADGQGPTQVTVQTSYGNSAQTNYQPQVPAQQNLPMPMPQSNFAMPYPPMSGSAPYPTNSSTAPYPTNSSTAPYPTNNPIMPYPPTQSSAPYPTAVDSNAHLHPPSYSQAVAPEGFQKQSAYNPSYNG